MLADYQTALSGAAFYTRPGIGLLHISGPDRLDFLQRQTTNDLRALAPGRVILTVLTSPVARIVDVLTTFTDGEVLTALTLPASGPGTAQFLRSRIFFMDKVTVEDASDSHALIDLIGPGWQSILPNLGITSLPTSDELIEASLNGVSARVFAQAGLGYRVLMLSASLSELESAFDSAGAVRLSLESHEILRIEAGLPAGGHELTEEYTPLEAGLAGAVSGEKGCYTGQEILARQITYDKVTRQLVGLRAESEIPLGVRLWVEGEQRHAGEITSTVTSPRFGAIALGIVRRPFHQPGSRLLVGDMADGIRAIVVPLPF